MAAAAGSHSNLYVGNLNGDATEDSLKNFFNGSTNGQVESCRVVAKDGKTNGFVKMVNVAAAQMAIEKINGQNGLVVKFANFDIGGKRQMYGQTQAWSKGWGKGAWGKGAYGYGFGGGYGGGYGYGYGGKGGWNATPKLLPREDEPERPEGAASENLYVKHWPVGVTEDEVKATFAKVGEVAECRLLRPDVSLEWAALVRMSSQDQATAARNSVDNTFPVIDQKPLEVMVQTKNGAPKEDHCYVKNVPSNTTKEKITALFGKYGEVKWCDVLSSARKDSSALVEMGSAEEAQKAITALNNQTVPLDEIGQTIKVRYALNKDKVGA